MCDRKALGFFLTPSSGTSHWKLEAAHHGNVHRMDTNVHHRNDKCHNIALVDCFVDGLDLESDGKSVTHGDQMHRCVCGAALQRPREHTWASKTQDAIQ